MNKELTILEEANIIVGNTITSTFYPNPTRNSSKSSSIYRLFRSGKMVVNKTYQRDLVWSKKQKQLLVDSMMRGWPIGSIFLWERESGKLEIVDGQQRIATMCDFIDDDFTTHSSETPMIAGAKRYSLIPPQYKALFDNYPISVIILRSTDSETVRRIFWRLNLSSPLTAGEHIHALDSALAYYLRHMATENPLLISMRVTEKRFRHLYAAAAMYISITTKITLGRGRTTYFVANLANRPTEEQQRMVDTSTRTVYNELRPFFEWVRQPKIIYLIVAVVAQLQEEGMKEFKHLYGFYKDLEKTDKEFGPESVQLRKHDDFERHKAAYLEYARTMPADIVSKAGI